jgi:CPA1 family monovalent cation:H+ antiporter
MLIASAVAIATKWVRVPYTLALVLVGLLISPMHFLPTVHISPELILLILLPALLFEAAWNLNFERLRADLLPILALSVVGVCLAVGLTGGILHYVIAMPWSVALLFGAMISATDPVSVLALFKEAGLPKRLSVLVEGESLLNDGTAVVVFRILLTIVAGSAVEMNSGMLWSSVREFGFVVVGGLAVGAVVGLISATVTAYINDHLLEITLTTITAYGSYLLAESFHVSPVIAVLAAGLIVGSYGRTTGMTPTTQIAVTSFWEYAAFVANSLVFLLIGLEIRVSPLTASAGMVAWAVAAMLVSRVVTVYGVVGLTNLLGAKVPLRWQHVLVWGGLRGSLSIALVLSLPTSLPSRSQLPVLVFGTVLFSLLVQGLTLSPLLKRLRLGQPQASVREYELVQAELMAAAAKIGELDALLADGTVSQEVHRRLREAAAEDRGQLAKSLRELQILHPHIEQERLYRVQAHLIDVQKSRLSELLRDGLISESTCRLLNEKLDNATPSAHR